ncbi:MAG TPA: lysozyme inhibitor LprI family protein [Gemmatimonadaceae bacterium]|jgi:uncharacterized protein YecT (DUF1311 family)
MRIPVFSTAYVVPALVGLCSLLVVAASLQSQVRRAGQPRCGTPLDCQKTADAAFKAEEARVGKDCAGASNQHEENICLSEAADKTERNLSTFYTALEGIVGSAPLRESQGAWVNYRKTQCDAIFTWYKRGTIAPSAQLSCQIALARSRMRDLESLFDTALHH